MYLSRCDPWSLWLCFALGRYFEGAGTGNFFRNSFANSLFYFILLKYNLTIWPTLRS